MTRFGSPKNEISLIFFLKFKCLDENTWRFQSILVLLQCSPVAARKVIGPSNFLTSFLRACKTQVAPSILVGERFFHLCWAFVSYMFPGIGNNSSPFYGPMVLRCVLMWCLSLAQQRGEKSAIINVLVGMPREYLWLFYSQKWLFFPVAMHQVFVCQW